MNSLSHLFLETCSQCEVIFCSANMRTLGNLIFVGTLCFLFKVNECTFQKVGNMQLSFEGADKRQKYAEAESICQSKNSQLVEFQSEDEWNEVTINASISLPIFILLKAYVSLQPINIKTIAISTKN